MEKSDLKSLLAHYPVTPERGQTHAMLAAVRATKAFLRRAGLEDDGPTVKRAAYTWCEINHDRLDEFDLVAGNFLYAYAKWDGSTWWDANVAWEAAQTQPIPAVATRYRSPRMRQGVLWLQEIQRAIPGTPFPLSGYMMGQRMGYTYESAYGFLMRLVGDGILEKVESGQGKMQANRYRYLPEIEPVRCVEDGQGVAG